MTEWVQTSLGTVLVGVQHMHGPSQALTLHVVRLVPVQYLLHSRCDVHELTPRRAAGCTVDVLDTVSPVHLDASHESNLRAENLLMQADRMSVCAHSGWIG